MRSMYRVYSARLELTLDKQAEYVQEILRVRNHTKGLVCSSVLEL